MLPTPTGTFSKHWPWKVATKAQSPFFVIANRNSSGKYQVLKKTESWVDSKGSQCIKLYILTWWNWCHVVSNVVKLKRCECWKRPPLMHIAVCICAHACVCVYVHVCRCVYRHTSMRVHACKWNPQTGHGCFNHQLIHWSLEKTRN